MASTSPESTRPGQASGRRNLPLLAAGVTLILIALLLLLLNGGVRLWPPGAEASVFPVQIELAPSAGQDTAAPAALPQVGDEAPDFTAVGLDGDEQRLAALRGRPVMVNFWATWCAPCRIEMPEIQRTFEAHQEQGLAILAVDMGESAEQVRDFFITEFGFSFTPLLDEDGDIAALYGAYNLPTTYFIDSEGTITAIHRGPMVLSQIEGYLEAILPPL